MFRISSQIEYCKHLLKIALKNKYYKCNSSYNLPDEADVVIIGGGNLGCNLLYQLSKSGINAILLEKNKITSGTTWHSNGLFWRLRPNDVEIQLLGCLPKLITVLEQETDLSTGFEINGGLFIARTSERLKEYKRLNTIGKYFNIDSEIISSMDASKLHPLLDYNSFTAALYSPNDGRIDPTMFCTALSKCAIKYGGKILEDCPVLDIHTDCYAGFKKIKSVTTKLGTIKTTCVVNAAGVWSADIAKMVNLDIPLVAFKHAYIITDRIPKVKGTPNVRDHDASICFKTLGDVLYIGGYERNPVFLKSVPSDFSFGLYDLDWDLFTVHMEKACELCPPLRNVGIKNDIYGPEAFTPDHKPLLGEDPRLSGFYYACGFNSAGMMLGTGCAEQLASWIINGRPDLPMTNYDIRRFSPHMQSNKVYIHESSHESYATNYDIVFPTAQPLAARNLKVDPIHQVLLDKGAVMEQSQGFERPGYFLKTGTSSVLTYDWYGCYGYLKNVDTTYVTQLETDYTFDFSKNFDLISDESLSARKNVALFNLSYFGKFYLMGDQSEEAANWLLTAKMVSNRTVESLLLNEQGRIEGCVNVLSLKKDSNNLLNVKSKGRSYYITAEGSTSYRIFYHLNKEIQKQNFNVQLLDVTESLAIFSLQGPKSEDVLNCIVDDASECKNLEPRASQLVTVNGNLCRVVRLTYIGELGFEIHVPNYACLSVINKIFTIGDQFQLRLAGCRAFSSLNCEKGNFIWNSDVTSEENPLEANLSHLCKNCNYLGKTYLENVKPLGVKKIRIFFTLNEHIPLWGLEVIWRNNVIVGFLKRGSYGYYLQKSIGIGYVYNPDGVPVSEEFIQSGQYEIEVMSKKYSAKAYLKSPFDSNDERLLGIY
ncbi:hypothetical protein FQR65_LT01689 [Abscondita terminalis]|nr:hypothetical protein FQR65_LT01689 [Abscondita terminalis]